MSIMKLYYIRHGQTEQNIRHIIQGQTHGKLSKEGKKQADLLGRRLKDEKFDIIYASDLERASDTARSIHHYQPHTPISFTSELRERNFGEYNGKPSDDAQIGWGKHTNILEHQNYLFPPGGETLPAMQKRAQKFLKKILSGHPNQTVAIVSHGTFGRAFLAAIRRTKVEKLYHLRLHNASISIFEITIPSTKNSPGKFHYKTIAFNDISHL